MIKLYLVRHARPTASWAEEKDPGLDAVGRIQAGDVADRLAAVGDLPIFTSPMRRCRETAVPLEPLWGRTADLLPAMSEIPSPSEDMALRQEWLAAAMSGTWGELVKTAPDGAPDYAAWRGALIETLLSIQETTVIFTHYIAINAAVGAALGDERVVVFRPDHCSATVLGLEEGGLSIIELGREAKTDIA